MLDSPWSDEQHGQFTRRGIVSDLVNFLKSHDIEKATLIGVGGNGFKLKTFNEIRLEARNLQTNNLK